MPNSTLNNAKRAKEDEFYTRREDIERELTHYADHFRGKVVYCNCDDPEKSEFWPFFTRNFWAYGLKKLIATHYEPDEKNFSYKLELTEKQDGQFYFDGPVKTPIQSNGDFRSACCIELLEEADIVVTNPPFSLFREYVAQLMKYEKKFIIIGSKNAVKYKEIFPLIKGNQLWLGYHPMSADMYFHVPDSYQKWLKTNKQKGSGYRIVDGEIMGRSASVWFTNLETTLRHTPIDLRGNYYAGNEEKYPQYVNFDGIEVGKISDIPCDYYGMMGVPITFMAVYCPEQFEIVGYSLDMATPISTCAAEGADFTKGGNCFYLDDGNLHYRRLYDRFVIRRKKDLK